MTEPAITPELVQKHNLTPEEYEKLKAILGREPSYTELGIFSVMWSEHCSYKNTRPLLKTFPTKSPKILVGAGEENAGIIDIGDGLAIAFKIESHNHPSAVEPFQGAATGVGGIVRDIFTMGARPVCSVNSLRFGPITEDGAATDGHASRITHHASAITNNRRLFGGVVAGIAHYGNCFGIPTVAGEVYFDKSYEGNPLVNAFCLGVLRHEQIARGAAKGIGQPGVLRRPGHRARRAGGRGVCVAGPDRGIRRAAARRGAGGRSVHGEAGLRGLPRTARHRRRRRHPGHGRGGFDLLDLRNGRARRDGHRDRTRQGSAARAEHEQLRDHAQRIAGAHAHHRPQGPRGGSEAHLRQMGSALVGDRHRHRHRPHGRAGTTARSWPIFPPGRSPTNRPSISARPGSPRI